MKRCHCGLKLYNTLLIAGKRMFTKVNDLLGLYRSRQPLGAAAHIDPWYHVRD